MSIRRVELVERPSAGLGDVAGSHRFVPFEGTGDVAVLVEGELAVSGGEEDDIVVAANAGVAAPFRTGVDLSGKGWSVRAQEMLRRQTHREATRLVGFIDESDRSVPVLLGDVEVVRGIAYDVEPGALLSVREVVE